MLFDNAGTACVELILTRDYYTFIERETVFRGKYKPSKELDSYTFIVQLFIFIFFPGLCGVT